MPVAFGRAGPVVHSFLFAVYHIAEPWMIPVRTLGLLPLIFATRYARSIVPAVLSHMLVNAQGAIASVLSES
jgi:membrane protease YdiL (CAAX protease family)